MGFYTLTVVALERITGLARRSNLKRRGFDVPRLEELGERLEAVG